MIRKASPSDAWAIAEIHNYYVKNTAVTTELECSTPYAFVMRIEQCGQVGPYLVHEDHGAVVGYACISEIRGRKACEHAAESRIYVKNGFVGQGIGSKLYAELLSQTVSRYQVIVAGITLSNEVGIKFHEKCGFSRVTHFSEATQKFGEWVEVGFWQKVEA